MTVRRTGIRRTGVRRTGVAVVAVLALVAATIEHVRAGDADAARRDAEDRLAVARAIAADETDGEADDEATLRDRRAALIDVLAATGDAEDDIDTRLGEQATEEQAIADAQFGIDLSTLRLAEVADVLGLQAQAIEPLRVCLSGMDAANRALNTADHDAASAALRDAAAACRRVQGTGGAGPVLPFDFPDPHIVFDGRRWWGYATNSTAGAVQMISSSDLGTWTVEGNALDTLPNWARPGATWAPAVVAHGGRWLLYYTVREDASGLQCISVASASSPSGPFSDTSGGPLVCERAEGGSIDPDPVVDVHGRLFLLWKTELDTRGHAAELRGSQMTDDGRGFVGDIATLLTAAGGWEGRTIEGPAMVQMGGYHLLYSAGSYNGSGYAVGVAQCETMLGPCTRQQSGPVLSTGGGTSGPGGLSVFNAGGYLATAYHAWEPGAVGYPNNRYLHLGGLSARGGGLSLQR